MDSTLLTVLTVQHVCSSVRTVKMCLIIVLDVILLVRIVVSSIMRHVILEVALLECMEIRQQTNANPVIRIVRFVLAPPKIIVLSATTC